MTSTTAIAQEILNTYLISIGSSPEDAVWGSMLDLTYLMPTLLERGGKYEKVFQYSEGETPENTYPTAMMKVIYANRYVHIHRGASAYPVINIYLPDMGYWVPPLKVHPDHLDIALCYILEVPEDNE